MGLWDSIVDLFTTGSSASSTAYQDPAAAAGAALGGLISNAISNNKNTSNKNNSTNKNTGLTSTSAKNEKVATKNNTTPVYDTYTSSSTSNKNSGALSSVLNAWATAPQDPAGALGATIGSAIGNAIVNAVNKDGNSTSSSRDSGGGGKASVSGGGSRVDSSNKTTSTNSNTGLTSTSARDEKLAIKNNTVPEYVKAEQNKNSSVSGGGIGGGSRVDKTTPTVGAGAAAAVVGGLIDSIVSNNNVSSGGGGYTPSTPSTGSSSSGYTPSAPPSGYYNGANWSGGTSYKPYPTAEEMSHYVSTIIQAAKNELGDVVKPEYVTAKAPDAPELRTLEDLAEAYGITYNYKSIYKILNDSVEKQYDAIYAKQKQNEDAYYDNASAAQNTLLDTLSRDRGNAVQAGVSKGMQAANALGAMLGVSQQFANNATALSQERNNTAKSYGADLAKAVVNAEATSNERKNAIMEIAKMLYGYDSEQYVANMDNYNTILTNNAALQQSYMNNSSNLQNALASIFGGVANNKIMGDANVQSSLLTSEAQKLAAQYAANAQKDVAAVNKEIAQLQQDLLKNEEVSTTDGSSSTGVGLPDDIKKAVNAAANIHTRSVLDKYVNTVYK